MGAPMYDQRSASAFIFCSEFIYWFGSYVYLLDRLYAGEIGNENDRAWSDSTFA